MKAQGLHVITNGKLTDHELISILKSVHPYVDFIHLREKQKTANELIRLIDQLMQVNIPLSKLIINDRVDVAYIKTCAGAQLAYHSPTLKLVQEKFPSLLIGKSVHSIREAKEAQRDGADYVIFGHVFPTASKDKAKPQGTQSLNELTNELNIPVVAIGGITVERVREVLDVGADGVAVMSGVLEAKNPVETVKAYHLVFNQRKEGCH